MKGYDVIVIGAGVMGTATARALARDGNKVLLLEQFVIGHKRGSSHGRSRIFRLSYPDPHYVSMAQEALPLWRELEIEFGQPLLTTTGGLDMGNGIDGNAKALESCDVEFEIITGSEANRRFETPRLPDGERVLYQPDAGFVAADATVMACARSALSDGAELVERTRVTSLDVSGDSIQVRTEDSSFAADRVVVTAGAWSKGLLGGAGIDLPTRPTRETVSYFRLPEATFPTLVEWGDPAVYALPSPGHGLKAGEHVAGPTADPDGEGEPHRSSVERVTAWVKERYPQAERKPLFYETCLYTNTRDEHFILERHGDIVVGSPCSGHGFKFAPLIGVKLAAMATSG